MFSGKVRLELVDSKFIYNGSLSFKTSDMSVVTHGPYITDGASIPRIFWTLLGSPLSPKLLKSSIIHDICYSSKAISRKEADILFRDMLIADGVNWIRANLLYLGVRLGGSSYWNNETMHVNKIKVIKYV